MGTIRKGKRRRHWWETKMIVGKNGKRIYYMAIKQTGKRTKIGLGATVGE